jgi:hypothetical protein
MKIPNLEQDKFSVIRAEYQTGIILNNNDNYYLSDDKNYFLVFNSLHDAQEFAYAEIREGKNKTEYYIYSYEGECIEFVQPLSIFSETSQQTHKNMIRRLFLKICNIFKNKT